VRVRRGGRRLPLREAADALGMSKDALRQRVRRGTIPAEKGEDGRVYVYLDASADATVNGQPGHVITPDDALNAELRARVESLERQLEQANERDRENRRIIAALTQRIPEIEAPSERSGAPVPPDAPGPSDTPTAASGERQEAAERVSWWRRMFGG
jgi:hypothetical protein